MDNKLLPENQTLYQAKTAAFYTPKPYIFIRSSDPKALPKILSIIKFLKILKLVLDTQSIAQTKVGISEIFTEEKQVYDGSSLRSFIFFLLYLFSSGR